MEIAIKKTVKSDFSKTVEMVREALKSEGFGVITEIDVTKTFKDKLDLDFRPYIILGACNPGFAHKALSASLEVGLLLPCNVIVYENDNGTSEVAAINPSDAMTVLNDDALSSVAKEVTVLLRKVIDRI